MLTSARIIICIFFRDMMFPMHLQILKLLRPRVLKKMRFQENIHYLTFDLGFVCFCCFTSHVNSYGHCGRSVHLTTLFPGQA